MEVSFILLFPLSLYVLLFVLLEQSFCWTIHATQYWENRTPRNRENFILLFFLPHCHLIVFLCTTAAMQLFISLYIHGMSIKSGWNSWSLIQCFKKLAFFYRFNEKCALVVHIYTRSKIMLACKWNNAWQIR